MGITIKIHNTDIVRELTDASEIWFYEKCKKQSEEKGLFFRAHLNNYGEIYYTSGELNIGKAARLLYEILNEQGKI